MLISLLLFIFTILTRKLIILLLIVEYILVTAKIYNPKEFNINIFFLIMGITAFITTFIAVPMTRNGA